MNCGRWYAWPVPGPEPKGKVQLSLTLLYSQRDRIDRLAEAWGCTRNAAARSVLEKGLAAAEREERQKRNSRKG